MYMYISRQEGFLARDNGAAGWCGSRAGARCYLWVTRLAEESANAVVLQVSRSSADGERKDFRTRYLECSLS